MEYRRPVKTCAASEIRMSKKWKIEYVDERETRSYLDSVELS